MRRILVVLALSAGAVLPVAAPAHHKPGHVGGGGAGTLSIAGTPNPVVFGRSVALTGKLGGADAAGKSVQVQGDSFPYEGDFKNLGTDTTNAQGIWAFSHAPAVNTRYRAKQGSTLSVVLTEKVRIRVSRRVSDGTPEAGTRVRFKGRACPQHDGATVKIKRRTSTGKWRTRARTTLKDIVGSTCSRYSKRVRVHTDGTYRVVVVTPDADHTHGRSRRKHIDVH